MKKYFIFIVLSLITTPTFAGTQLAAQTIKSINMGWGSEGIYITTNESLMAESCTGAVARMPSNHSLLKENISVLLSAFHTNSKVLLYVDGCLDAQMHLKAVAIQK